MTTHVPLLDTTMANLRRCHPLLGMAITHHQTIRGKALSFKDRPFQVEQYKDFCNIEGADICKAVQTGQSEMFTLMCLHQAGWLGRIVAYVLPTDSVRNRFVSTRVNRLLRQVPSYRQRLPGADAQDLLAGETGSFARKNFGGGLLLFLGARTPGNFVELTADTFVVDEYDQSKSVGPENLERVIDRLKEADNPQHFRLGNAELPGGITALLEAGDYRMYHWQCDHCGERQPIDWTTNVVDRLDNGDWQIRDPAARKDRHHPIRPVCVRCGKPFTRRADGAAWVPKQPFNDRRSYLVTRFDVMAEPLRVLWEEWLKSQASVLKLKEWYRRNAGRLYEPASNKLTEEQLRQIACLPMMDWAGGAEYEGRAITAGIDIGGNINVTISETVKVGLGTEGEHTRREVRWVGTVRTEEQVLDLLQRYHVRTCVIDNDPEPRSVERIQTAAQEFGCTVWLCRFHPHPKTTQERFGLTTDWRAGTVKVDRTQVFDEATHLLHVGSDVGRMILDGKEPGKTIDGARLYPVDALDALGWIHQMVAPKRMMKNDRIVWDEGDKEDHYRLADVYDLVAFELDSYGAVVVDVY